MSQQQMDSGEINRTESRLSSSEYEAGTHYDREASVLYRQKLTATMNSSPSPGQRLALAIVSLVLWVVVFLIVVLSLITTPSIIFVSSVASTTSYDNQAWHVLYPLVIAGLLIFSVFVFAINLLFYRKR
jgi:hypothetical protein